MVQLPVLFFFVTRWQFLGLAVTVALAAAHVMVMPRLRYRVHRWELTAEALYTRDGWLTVNWEIAPVSRVQTVTTHRGPLERRLGLSTLTVTTASAMGPICIEGLAREDAVELADTLTRITDATPGDAT